MKKIANRAALVLYVSMATCAPPAVAQSDVWNELLRAMNFGAIMRAQLEFMCTTRPDTASNHFLVNTCVKRRIIPDSIINAAALPHMKRHLTDRLAQQALTAWSTVQGQKLSRIMIRGIASGTREYMSPAESALLEQRGNSEYGRAASAFASDLQQSAAVVRAINGYQPQLPKTGFISGRVATSADIEAGNAAFVGHVGATASKPMAIRIPQFAYYGIGKEKVLVTIIQAEVAQGMKMIGAHYGGDGANIVGSIDEFELLGTLSQ